MRPVAADGRPYTAADVRAAVPVRMGAGYAFALGDPDGDDPRFIRGENGRPWVLPWTGSLEQQLRTRVPGAFRGGR